VELRHRSEHDVRGEGWRCHSRIGLDRERRHQPVTINGPGGTNIQQPLPAATAFAANYVLNLVEQQGSSYVWGNLGSSGGYSLGPS
jgi:hypothetical protein